MRKNPRRILSPQRLPFRHPGDGTTNLTKTSCYCNLVSGAHVCPGASVTETASSERSEGIVQNLKDLESGGNGGPGGGEDGGNFGFGEGKERPDDNRVKLSTACFIEPAYGFLERQPSSIGPRRNHGIKGIDNADDARHNGNLGALEPSGVALTVKRFVMMEYIKSRTLETREHAQHGPAVLGVFFHERVFIRIEASGLAKDGIRDSYFADVVQERGNLEILKFGLFQAQFLSDAHTPFREPSAVDAGIEILQVEQLIERTDDRIAKRGNLLFELFDAKRFQRPGRGIFRGRRNLVIRHCSYQQSKRQEPEPPEVEPELLTQAETAWYTSRRPRLRSGVSLIAWDSALAAWL